MVNRIAFFKAGADDLISMGICPICFEDMIYYLIDSNTSGLYCATCSI